MLLIIELHQNFSFNVVHITQKWTIGLKNHIIIKEKELVTATH